MNNATEEMQQNSHWENDNFHQISIYRQTAKATVAAAGGGSKTNKNKKKTFSFSHWKTNKINKKPKTRKLLKLFCSLLEF